MLHVTVVRCECIALIDISANTNTDVILVLEERTHMQSYLLLSQRKKLHQEHQAASSHTQSLNQIKGTDINNR